MTRGALAPPVCAALKQNGGGLFFRLCSAVKPANARSSVNAIIAHWESVGMGVFAVVGVPTLETTAGETVLLPPLVCKAPMGPSRLSYPRSVRSRSPLRCRRLE